MAASSCTTLLRLKLMIISCPSTLRVAWIIRTTVCSRALLFFFLSLLLRRLCGMVEEHTDHSEARKTDTHHGVFLHSLQVKRAVVKLAVITVRPFSSAPIPTWRQLFVTRALINILLSIRRLWWLQVCFLLICLVVDKVQIQNNLTRF